MSVIAHMQVLEAQSDEHLQVIYPEKWELQ